MYYTKSPDVVYALRDTAVLRLSLVKDLHVLDLSWSFGERPPSVQKYLDSLDKDPDVRSAIEASSYGYKGMNFEEILRWGVANPLDNDYSLGRACGLAAANSGFIDGLRAGTARETDRQGETGNNVVLFGTEGKPPHDKVRVEAVTLFDDRVGHKRDVEFTTYKVKFDYNSQEYKLD